MTIPEHMLRTLAQSIVNAKDMKHGAYIEFVNGKLRGLVSKLQKEIIIPKGYIHINNLLKPQTAAQHFHVHPTSLHQWINKGWVDSIELDRVLYIKVDSLENYLINNNYLTEPDDNYVKLEQAKVISSALPYHVIQNAIRAGVIITKKFAKNIYVELESLNEYINNSEYSANYNQRRAI